MEDEKMRKLLSVFLCALMVLSVLAGCAGKQTSENTDAAPSTSATTKSTETAQPEPKENVELTFVSMEDAKLPYFENSQAVFHFQVLRLPLPPSAKLTVLFRLQAQKCDDLHVQAL
jgi:predicted small lipoprotein YifL